MACAMAFDLVQNRAHEVWENNTTHIVRMSLVTQLKKTDNFFLLSVNDSFSGCIIYIFGTDIYHTAIIQSLCVNEIIRKQTPHKIKTRVANSLL